MSALLTPAAPLRGPEVAVDEAAARRALRAQIARLEGEAGSAGAVLRAPAGWGAPSGAPAPRLLTLADLERTRDELVDALRDARRAGDALGQRQEGFRRLREEILLDPAAHPYVRVTNADIGEPGCHDWHVRPRFGVLGALMRWWRVVVSSGCP